MPKGKKNTDETADKAAKKTAFTGHHKRLIAAGEQNIFTSRPRGMPYQIEEWLNGDRKFTLRKAFDNGRVVTFVEGDVEDYNAGQTAD